MNFKKRLVIFLVIILLSSFVSGYCVNPRDGKSVFKTTQFCTQTYQLREGISIGRNELTLDCGNAVIQGLFTGKTGITIENKKNILIKNCILMNYDVGIHLINSTNITIQNIALIRNQIGAKVEKSDKNRIINSRDISLKKPVQ
ncbi:hypothetical protein GF358_02335, partial [Candidatus Woesearchaeota archaeon]|nr:hypothetical protein [Candidatus Woesearchaeota archaeon]